MNILPFKLGRDSGDLDLKAARRALGRLDPKTVQLQPVPTFCEMSVLQVGGRTATAIRRDWAPGDASHCKLCTVCDAHRDACVKLVDFAVPPAEAAMFSTVGLAVQGEPPRPRASVRRGGGR